MAGGRAGRARGRPPRQPARGDRERLRGLAGELGLLVTGASDYHGAGKDNRLGENTTDPGGARGAARPGHAAACRMSWARAADAVSNADVKFFIEVFVTLFVIMDPPGTVPLFLSA